MCIRDSTQARFRKLMNVPEDYEILFLQGGASTQFSAIPMNLIGKTGKADYAVTGNFAEIAYKEARKYGQISLAASSADRNHSYIPVSYKHLTNTKDVTPPMGVKHSAVPYAIMVGIAAAAGVRYVLVRRRRDSE